MTAAEKLAAFYPQWTPAQVTSALAVVEVAGLTVLDVTDEVEITAAALAAGWVELGPGVIAVDLDQAQPLLADVLRNRIAAPKYTGYSSPVDDAAAAVVTALRQAAE